MKPVPILLAVALAAVAGAGAWLFLGDDPAVDPVRPAPSAAATAEARDTTAPGDLAAAPDLDSLVPAAATRVEEAAVEAPAETAAARQGRETGASRVVGRVVDVAGGPIADADVTLGLDFGRFVTLGGPQPLPGEKQTKTGKDGTFAFDGVALAQARRVRVRPAHHADVKADVPAQNPEGGSAVVDLGTLVAELGGSVTGHVLDAVGNPVPGATVAAWTRIEPKGGGPDVFVFGDAGFNDARRTTADASGFYRIDGLAPGEVTALAMAKGFTTESRGDVKVERGAVAAHADVRLSRGESLAGVVVGGDGKPLEGARVQVRETVLDLSDGAGLAGFYEMPKFANTDAGGRFELAGLRPGTYDLVASAEGHLRLSSRNVATGTLDLALRMRQAGSIAGRVTDRESGAPIDTFAVTLDGAVTTGPARIVTGAAPVLRGKEAAEALGVDNPAGLYLVPTAPGETVSLTIEADGYAPARFESLDVAPGVRLMHDVQLAAETRLTGVVLDPQGRPVADAALALRERAPDAAPTAGFGFRSHSTRVEVRDDGDGPRFISDETVHAATSDEDGRFVFRGLEAGDYELQARHESLAPSEPMPLSLEEGEHADDVEVLLRAGGAVEGVAHDADGAPLAGARILLRPAPRGGAGGAQRMAGGFRIGGGGGNFALPDFAEPAGSATSDEEGRYAIRAVLPGEYLAELREPHGGASGAMSFHVFGGQKPDGVPVTITEGATATLDLYLPPTGAVEGLVTASGRPQAGVAVSLKKKDALPFAMGGPRGVTDEHGNFLLEDVEPGDYTLVTSPKQAPRPIERDVTVRARATERVPVALPTGGLAGRVIDRDSGQPVEGVQVIVEPAGGDGDESGPRPRQVIAQAVMIREDGTGGGGMVMKLGDDEERLSTDADGFFEARYLEPGDYRVVIRGQGISRDARERVRVTEGEIAQGIDFEAVRGAVLVVKPQFPAGVGDEGGPRVLTVTYASEDDPGNVESRTEIGRDSMRIDGLAPGRYRVTVNAGRRRGEVNVEIGSGEEKEVPVRLE